MTESNWSEDRITTLTSLWLGGLSASQIAKQLGGVTRNAVIGKVHRLGLSGRAQPSRPARLARAPRRAAAPRPRPVARMTPPLARPQPAPEGPGLVPSLAALGAHACKWPIGDPKAADFSFCGRLANGPYCPSHKTAAFQPGTAWRADRDPSLQRALAGLG
ncbi:MAG TPA: GcrA family cell cycle regulator [Caulobacteraceae bacterium]|nr:GcrA family cell cycle regulator [Caulobacteraceae bacterium]